MPPSTETILLSDGYQSVVRWWRSDAPRGAVLYLHGIQSHGGWYEDSAAALADRGLAVLMPDRRGSGANADQRGHVDSVSRCIQDGVDALDILLEQTRAAAAHLVGVSWGGKLAVALATAEPRRVRSITLVAPGLFPRVDLSRSEKFRVAMSMINDRTRMFDIPLNDPRLFTSDPARIRWVENDELKLTQVSAGFLLVTRRLDRRVTQLGTSGFDGGLHVFLAGRDRIIDNERTRQWVRGLPMADRHIREFPDAEHTLEFESDPREFIQSMADWIVERCDGPPRRPD